MGSVMAPRRLHYWVGAVFNLTITVMCVCLMIIDPRQHVLLIMTPCAMVSLGYATYFAYLEWTRLD